MIWGFKEKIDPERITTFWAFMAQSVFLGQLYVGYGYRLMHGSMQDLWIK